MYENAHCTAGLRCSDESEGAITYMADTREQPPPDASEVTYALLFLTPDASRYITGSPILVDAGLMTKQR